MPYPYADQTYTARLADYPNALPSNAIGSVILAPLGTDTDPVISYCFKRAEGTPNEPLIYSRIRMGRDAQPPPRLPSSLPPPENHTLALHLGKLIGRGRSGVVFEAIGEPGSSSPELATMAIPPLVVKVSRQGHQKDIEHEAYYYDEMQCIQGVIVPRFYGLFQGSLPPGISFDSTENEGSGSDDGSEDFAESEEVADKRHTNDASTVSLLVLERVGERLPLREELPQLMIDEILDMFTHLSMLGITYSDIRYANILWAPSSPPGWPGLVSPFSKIAYHCRLIDFEHSCKTNRGIAASEFYFKGWVTRLLDNMADGYIIEPWDF